MARASAISDLFSAFSFFWSTTSFFFLGTSGFSEVGRASELLRAMLCNLDRNYFAFFALNSSTFATPFPDMFSSRRSSRSPGPGLDASPMRE